MKPIGTLLIEVVKKGCVAGLNGAHKMPPKIGNLFSNPYAVEAMPEYFFKPGIIEKLTEMLKGKSPQKISRFLNTFGSSEESLLSVINRYTKLTSPKTSPKKLNDLLSELYEQTAKLPGKNPEIRKQFSAKAKAGEFKGADLFEHLLGRKYELLRTTEYPLTSRFNPKIDEITRNATSHIKVKEQGGWHYRILKGKEAASTQYRISLNVNAEEDLIKKFDKMVISGKLKGNYKTPDMSANWLERHDPVTIYLESKPTKEFTDELAALVKPHIRSTADVLPGRVISPGIAEEIRPSSADVERILRQARQINPDFEKAITSFLSNPHNKGELKASAGQMRVIEDLMKSIS